MHRIYTFGCINNDLRSESQNDLIKFKMGTCTVHSDLTIKLAFKKRLMLKISAISNDLNNILDELHTILDDPYDRYLSGAQTLTATTSTIVYFYVNSQ